MNRGAWICCGPCASAILGPCDGAILGPCVAIGKQGIFLYPEWSLISGFLYIHICLPPPAPTWPAEIWLIKNE